MQRAADMPQVIEARNPPGRLASCLGCGKEQADQYGHHGDHHEQFDERHRAAV